MKHSIDISESVQYQRGHPLDRYSAWEKGSSEKGRLLLVDFDIQAYWLEDSPSVSLTAIYLRSSSKSSISVTDQALTSSDLAPLDQYRQWSADHDMVQYSQGSLIGLLPLAIAKPWGQEIWYTGVEARGVCCFRQGHLKTPIPWLQAAVPGSGLGNEAEALVLLKILDPLAQPVVGDLYFELHEEKQEVYVVTHIDKDSWPDGVGYIRMGFDRQKLDSFGGDKAAFRLSYLAAVKAYEAVRREIDALPSGTRVLPEQQDRESRLRIDMDNFSQLSPLVVGDVVKVPLLTPHSLQHGVRTVEFQTPVYERKILSFAQRVLTQNHWDTQEAVELMVLEQAPEDDFVLIESASGIQVERIVDFSDFDVCRVSLTEGASMSFAAIPSYALIMVIQGKLSAGGVDWEAEEALILPTQWSGELTFAKPESAGVLLLATPRY